MSYLSKKGYVIKKENLSSDELTNLKKELRARPLVDEKFNKNPLDCSYPIYVETKNKLYIPKMYGINKFGFPDKVLDNYNGKEWTSPVEFNGTLLERQIEPVNALLKACEENGGGILQAMTGSGKCHGINTPILMFDGTIKMIQDIQVGDILMGDDSTPRNVLSLARGEDEMYDIIPVKGNKYTVNQEHILVLKISGKPTISTDSRRNSYWSIQWFENNKYNSKCFNDKKKALEYLNNVKQQKIMEIAVKDYLNLSKSIKRILKGYKVYIDFSEKELDFDPYIIGFWLGDGNSNGSGITNQDSVPLHYMNNILHKYKCYLQYNGSDNNLYCYRINGNSSGNAGCNTFLNALKNNNLINNKHIPMIYKCNSRDNRLKLLAGLIDSDGSLCNGCFDFVQKSEKLIDDVIYLCRSLGFSCYKSKQKKGCWYKGKYKEDDYFRISISGYGTHEIPTLCPRKKANVRKQIKDVLVTGITVKHVGRDNYYGFTLDGNNRYVLGDFTVTHNTFMSIYLLSKLKSKAIIIVNKITLMNQWKDEINKFLPDVSVGILQGQKNIDIHDKDITIAMLQSLSRIDYPDSYFNEFAVSIFDEVHNIPSLNFSKVLFKLTSKYTIGLSATPKRSDGCEYVFKWHLGDIVYESTVDRVGKPPIIKCIKISSKDYTEVSTINKFTGQKQIQFTSMITLLIEMEKRNKLVIELIKNAIKEKRKILVLSDRRNHLKTLYTLLENDRSVTFTYGLFLGSMKIEELNKSKACDTILATYASFNEGISVSSLDTLITISPKKFIGHLKNTTKNESNKIEQIVGRIFRKDHITLAPMIIDFQDDFSVYKNQSNGRNAFYKLHFKTGIFETLTINLDDYNIEDISVKCITTKKSKKVEKDIPQQTNLITQFCMLEE